MAQGMSCESVHGLLDQLLSAIPLDSGLFVLLQGLL
jgi:hypothetical protein